MSNIKETLIPSKIVQLMSNIPFFKDFNNEEKRAIAEIKNALARFPVGEYIIRQGTFERSIYILLKGKAAVTKKEVPRAVIHTLNPGDVFGELSFLSKRPRGTNIVAKTDVMVLQFHVEFFDKLAVEIREKLKDQFLHILINRLDNMNDSVVQLKSEMEAIFQAEEQVKENLNGVAQSIGQVREQVNGISDVIVNLIR
jgi:CRP-like cAMP-binding protein